MKREATALLIGVAFLLNIAVWGQTSTETGANGNGQASVQSNQTNAQVSSGVSSSSSVSTKSAAANGGLASGTTFNAALNASVDSKKAKVGDEITARTMQTVRADGKTILPKGTKLAGHITRATARAKGDSESALGITFDRAILRNGQEVPLNLAIQALASAQGSASASDNDMDAMVDAGAGAGASGMSHSRGALGNVASTTGSSLGGVTNTAAKVGDTGKAALNSTTNSSAGVTGSSQVAVGGLNAAGQLMSNSRGVFNLDGVSLSSGLSSDTQGSVVASAGKNVHLDGGTRMLLVTQAAASAPSSN